MPIGHSTPRQSTRAKTLLKKCSLPALSSESIDSTTNVQTSLSWSVQCTTPKNVDAALQIPTSSAINYSPPTYTSATISAAVASTLSVDRSISPNTTVAMLSSTITTTTSVFSSSISSAGLFKYEHWVVVCIEREHQAA